MFPLIFLFCLLLSRPLHAGDIYSPFPFRDCRIWSIGGLKEAFAKIDTSMALAIGANMICKQGRAGRGSKKRGQGLRFEESHTSTRIPLRWRSNSTERRYSPSSSPGHRRDRAGYPGEEPARTAWELGPEEDHIDPEEGRIAPEEDRSSKKRVWSANGLLTWGLI